MFLGVKKFNFLIYSVCDGFVSRVVAIYFDADVLRCQSFYFACFLYQIAALTLCNFSLVYTGVVALPVQQYISLFLVDLASFSNSFYFFANLIH